MLDCLFIYVILIHFIATRAEMRAFESWPTPTGELKERLRAFGDTSADLNESETEGGLQRWLHSLRGALKHDPGTAGNPRIPVQRNLASLEEVESGKRVLRSPYFGGLVLGCIEAKFCN